MTTLAPDLLDLGTFAASREHALFRELRDRDPVFFNPEPAGPGFWSLTRYDDVASAARDHDRLRSGQGTQIADRRAEGKGHASVHNSDRPQHGRLRGIVLPSLARQAILAREPVIARIIERLVRAVVPGETFDFVERIAVRLPMLVIADVLGVPEEDADRLVDWANLMSDVRASDQEQAEARGHLNAYFRDLAEAKRAHAADDLASALVAAGLEGEALDAYFMVLTVAGNETTRFLVSGGFAQLIRQMDDLLRVAGDRRLVAPLVEEMIRFVSPVTHMRRTAAEPMELHGVPIPAGGKVVLWFASANHDERHFADPDRLVIDRSPNAHLGFGLGAHFCVGSHLAKLEAVMLLNALFDRFSRFELAGEPTRLVSNWFTGWTAMPVRFA